MSPKKSAFIGFLFALPFVIINFIVSLRLEPLYSILGSFPIIRNSILLPLFLLLLFPIGAFITARPIFTETKNGKRKFYLVNSIVAVLLLAAFLVTFIGLGEDMYRCDVLKIPNCD